MCTRQAKRGHVQESLLQERWSTKIFSYLPICRKELGSTGTYRQHDRLPANELLVRFLFRIRGCQETAFVLAALRLEAIALRLEAVARLEAITLRLEAIALS